MGVRMLLMEQWTPKYSIVAGISLDRAFDNARIVSVDPKL